jgi:hypothetical protein
LQKYSNEALVVTFGTKRRRSLGNVCKHRSMERSGVKCFHYTHVFDLTNLKGEKRRNVGKLNNKLSIVSQLVERFIEKIGQTLIQQSVIQPLDYSG